VSNAELKKVFMVMVRRLAELRLAKPRVPWSEQRAIPNVHEPLEVFLDACRGLRGCRKIILVSKAAIAGGVALLLFTMLGLFGINRRGMSLIASHVVALECKRPSLCAVTWAPSHAGTF
jgi:hypothetical protein